MKKDTTPAVNVKITQDEQNPIDVEVIASAILKLDAAAQKLVTSGLRQEAIVVLLHDLTKVGKPDIRYVLNGLLHLRKRYTTK